jgi:hypothetical protein
MSTYKYDDPTLDNIAFLLAVMHDPSVALDQRIRVAECLIKLGYGDIAHPPRAAVIYRFADFHPEPATDESPKEPAHDIAA